MAHNQITVLVIAPQGPDRFKLLSKLAQRPDYEPVESTGDPGQVLKLVKDSQPALIIIDSTLSSSWSILRLLKTAWPVIPCIVLAKNIWQKNYARQIGCDLAFSAMTLADPQLLAIIDEWLIDGKQLERPSAPIQSFN
jgi:DNA-binding NarL/FixJ family response regulator